MEKIFIVQCGLTKWAKNGIPFNIFMASYNQTHDTQISMGGGDENSGYYPSSGDKIAYDYGNLYANGGAYSLTSLYVQDKESSIKKVMLITDGLACWTGMDGYSTYDFIVRPLVCLENDTVLELIGDTYKAKI